MDNQQNFTEQNIGQAPEAPAPYQQPTQPENHTKSSGLKVVLYMILALIVLGAAAFAGYYYNDTQSTETSKIQVTNSDQTTEQSSPAKADTYHFIASERTIFGSGQIVKTQLALPNFVQSINIPSDNQNPGYIEILSDKYNDEMANWVIGDPELPTSSQVGTVTLERVDRAVWKSQPPYEGFESVIGTELFNAKTASAKDAALNSYASRAKSCSGSESKHYLISGFFDMCTTLSVAPPQAIDSYVSILLVEGYGKKDGQEFVMLGSVRLEGAEEVTEAAQKSLAKEYSQAKKPLKHSVDHANLYRDALQHTTITITK